MFHGKNQSKVMMVVALMVVALMVVDVQKTVQKALILMVGAAMIVVTV